VVVLPSQKKRKRKLKKIGRESKLKKRQGKQAEEERQRKQAEEERQRKQAEEEDRAHENSTQDIARDVVVDISNDNQFQGISFVIWYMYGQFYKLHVEHRSTLKQKSYTIIMGLIMEVACMACLTYAAVRRSDHFFFNFFLILVDGLVMILLGKLFDKVMCGVSALFMVSALLVLVVWQSCAVESLLSVSGYISLLKILGWAAIYQVRMFKCKSYRFSTSINY
jgi:hypothetical protein